MVTAFVVDESPSDRHLAGELLDRAGYTTRYAASGPAAVALAEEAAPDIVLAGTPVLGVPGIGLLNAMRAQFPNVPIVVLAAEGNDALTVAALHSGAVSYVSKRRLAADLVATVDSVLEVRRAARGAHQVMASLVAAEWRFVIENDVTTIPPIVGYLEDNLTRLRVCDRNVVLQVGIALREALINGIFHGNLEVPSSLREDGSSAYQELADRRKDELPYRLRRVRLRVRDTADAVAYTVSDEGPGFTPAALPDPTDPLWVERVSGRGLLLIRSFMDEVVHNDRGNEITLVKRFGPPTDRTEVGSSAMRPVRRGANG